MPGNALEWHWIRISKANNILRNTEGSGGFRGIGLDAVGNTAVSCGQSVMPQTLNPKPETLNDQLINSKTLDPESTGAVHTPSRATWPRSTFGACMHRSRPLLRRQVNPNP